MSSASDSSPRPAPTVGGTRELFGQLRRAALLAPFGIALLLELTHLLLDPIFSPWVDRLLVVSLVLVCAAVFYHHVFVRLEVVQERLHQQNRELYGLHLAGLSVSSTLSLDRVLDAVVASATDLIGTRYGALSVIGDDGRIRHFLTAGIDPEQADRIGPPPTGHGILSVVLEKGHRLRLSNLGRDTRSVGFPEHHPVMRSLLAVPISCNGPFRGNLYLSEKLDGGEFTQAEEETLVRFAHQAAVAIDNAYLHGEVQELGAARERIRIAHEMHDGLAQVLAYVNTKAQVIKEHLRKQRVDEAEKHLDQLASASRQVYDDVRAQILELRTTAPHDRGLVESLHDYIDQWTRHTQLEVNTTLPESIHLAPDVELQLLRIVQESLTNVRKHSSAKTVDLRLSDGEQGLILVIEDDGTGFDLGPSEGTSPTPHLPRFGLTTMRERAEAVGGTWNLESSPGRGTRVEVRLPHRSYAHVTEDTR